MKTNDIKKGDRILLSNGWYATMADNARGNTRMAKVEGHYTEIGSVYSHDIMAVVRIEDNRTIAMVEHTTAQDKLREIAGGM